MYFCIFYVHITQWLNYLPQIVTQTIESPSETGRTQQQLCTIMVREMKTKLCAHPNILDEDLFNSESSNHGYITLAETTALSIILQEG